MKIVVGAPIKDRAWVIPEWHQAIVNQSIDVEIIALVSVSEDKTVELLDDRGVEVAYDFEDGRSTGEIDGHVWGAGNTYEYMASLRNKLTQWAIEKDADFFFSLDSDIILPPDGLRVLLEYAQTRVGVLSPAVNMTIGQTVWNTMDWVDRNRPSLANRISQNLYSYQADVVMAAMMLDRSAMECKWQSHQQGEDVGFCLDAEARRIPRWWIPEVQCDHLMRKY